MRLLDKEVMAIKKACLRCFPNKKFKICLYGSRVRDDLKGGDVDVFLLSPDLWSTEEQSKIISFLSYLKNETEFTDQKINFSLVSEEELAADSFWKSVKYIVI